MSCLKLYGAANELWICEWSSSDVVSGRPRLQDCPLPAGTGDSHQLSEHLYPRKQCCPAGLTAKGALVQGPLADIVMSKNARLGRTPESQKEREANVAFLNVAESVLSGEWVDLPSHYLPPGHLPDSLTKSTPAMCTITIQRDFKLLTPLHYGA